MRILLDENVARAIYDLLAGLGHKVDRIGEVAPGLKNGEVYRKARDGYDLFITNDRDFLDPRVFPPTQSLGILFLRIKMTHLEKQVESVRRLFAGGSPDNLKGTLTVLKD